MSEKILFELVSPERLLLSTEAEMVSIQGTDGDMGVMAGHMPLITTLRPGFITLTGADNDTRYYVSGGFAEVTANKLTVLADDAKSEDELEAEKTSEQTA